MSNQPPGGVANRPPATINRQSDTATAKPEMSAGTISPTPDSAGLEYCRCARSFGRLRSSAGPVHDAARNAASVSVIGCTDLVEQYRIDRHQRSGKQRARLRQPPALGNQTRQRHGRSAETPREPPAGCSVLRRATIARCNNERIEWGSIRGQDRRQVRHMNQKIFALQPEVPSQRRLEPSCR